MSFICLTTSQQLRCSQPFKIRSRKSICKIMAVWFRSCLSPAQTSWNQSLVLFHGLLMRPLAQQSKISRYSRSWQNVIALVCSPSLALLANNYEFLSCRFFVGLLMRAMGLSVCVNGFRKFMQLATHGAGRTNNNQPSPKRLFTRATINTHPTPPGPLATPRIQSNNPITRWRTAAYQRVYTLYLTRGIGATERNPYKCGDNIDASQHSMLQPLQIHATPSVYPVFRACK